MAGLELQQAIHPDAMDITLLLTQAVAVEEVDFMQAEQYIADQVVPE